MPSHIVPPHDATNEPEQHLASQALEMSLTWLSRNLEFFRGEFWESDSERSAFPYGPMVELLQIANVVDLGLLTLHFDCDALVEAGSSTLLRYRGTSRHTAFVELGLKELQDLEDRRYAPHQPLSSKLRQRAGPLEFSQTGANLDDAYLMERLTDVDSSANYSRILQDFWRSKSGGIGLQDAYFLTHCVFYSTHFGRRHHTFDPPTEEALERTLVKICDAAARSSNNDLLLECDSALALLGTPRTVIDALGKFTQQFSADDCIWPTGEVPSPPPTGREVFRAAYHSVIAFALLAATFYRRCEGEES